MSVPTAAPRPPSPFGDRYRLDGLIGTGGGSRVHRAHDLLLDRDVAVKVFVASTADPRILAQQQDEARLLASFTHHNLVTLLDVAVEPDADGVPHMLLVTDLVEGLSLQQWIERGPLPSRQVAYVGFDVAEALDYVHLRGVTHHDVSPENVLVLEHGGTDVRLRGRLADFGLATIVGAEDRHDGAASTAGGAYLSPEQALGGPAGPSSDVYSLGLVLLEALIGHEAFLRSGAMSVSRRRRTDPEIPHALPEALVTLLRRMTAREPDDRPTAADVVRALRAHLVDDLHRHIEPVDATPEPDEAARLAALHRYDLLDTPPEGAFDRITDLAARVLRMPVATVSIVDHDRIWFKSSRGIDGAQIARDPGLCATVVATGHRIHVPDASLDPSTAENPLIAGELGLRSYAGVPLTSSDGHVLGALGVADYVPRTLTERELTILADLGAMVTHEMEMRLATRRAVLSHD